MLLNIRCFILFHFLCLKMHLKALFYILLGFSSGFHRYKGGVLFLRSQLADT